MSMQRSDPRRRYSGVCIRRNPPKVAAIEAASASWFGRSDALPALGSGVGSLKCVASPREEAAETNIKSNKRVRRKRPNPSAAQPKPSISMQERAANAPLDGSRCHIVRNRQRFSQAAWGTGFGVGEAGDYPKCTRSWERIHGHAGNDVPGAMYPSATLGTMTPSLCEVCSVWHLQLRHSTPPAAASPSSGPLFFLTSMLRALLHPPEPGRWLPSKGTDDGREELATPLPWTKRFQVK
ncbi:hypothetical protein B0J15DRAFT_461540 [Fusarium solani]|uniref:Uncharacterized protein n=1 Tax=Fusarium solani TaxID=169388 RepID=A0A9P9L004_FUSSL|nr:uncharacterized protein B0J15DRAFT_461540 [Fusarium solani]KAH7271504.1 hypothetical protein B0J15DRAFT_461540 [Fusarium solani]